MGGSRKCHCPCARLVCTLQWTPAARDLQAIWVANAFTTGQPNNGNNLFNNDTMRSVADKPIGSIIAQRVQVVAQHRLTTRINRKEATAHHYKTNCTPLFN